MRGWEEEEREFTRVIFNNSGFIKEDLNFFFGDSFTLRKRQIMFLNVKTLLSNIPISKMKYL